ncbi:MAG: RluA family pseudouridine synthase [Butyrivibrio sp.]|jgi:23S rRNA pseudouridine1911/1915/1917 synthase|nr:RluA family pseudouridine synthase [Butyrivibrio sp.]
MTVTYLYEDDDILVCVKPAGMATESAGLGVTDLVSTLRTHLVRQQRQLMRGAAQTGKKPSQPPYLALIHRLDQPVEGILVFGKNKAAAADLSRQLQNHTMQKDYLAVLVGRPERECGELTDYLLKDAESGEVRVVPADTKGAQKAQLTYKVIASASVFGQEKDATGETGRGGKVEVTLVSVHLLTGRFHQIRAQMAHMGTPILGDHRFNDAGMLALAGQCGAEYIALCCCHLQFRHPVTKRLMEYRITPGGAAFMFTEFAPQKV